MLQFSGNSDQPLPLSSQMKGATTHDLAQNASIPSGGIPGMAF